MSGGVSNITIENILVWKSRRAIRIKTAPGRDISFTNIRGKGVTLNTKAFEINRWCYSSS
ncbi:polygalacturonase-like protein, putative [Medicago truncatula]|uniref:Polygalacturonase-like protein, putative n=1 Tax=Medicago truncatula TaxID=3880 RepID=G7IIP5_MEDTR|nr:polygalacturonase-like protein, putative [Medicago truncatula]